VSRRGPRRLREGLRAQRAGSASRCSGRRGHVLTNYRHFESQFKTHDTPSIFGHGCVPSTQLARYRRPTLSPSHLPTLMSLLGRYEEPRGQPAFGPHGSPAGSSIERRQRRGFTHYHSDEFACPRREPVGSLPLPLGAVIGHQTVCLAWALIVDQSCPQLLTFPSCSFPVDTR